MKAKIKNSETGSAPYHLNISNTAKDFSDNNGTNPQTGLLELLSKSVLIKNDIVIENSQVIENTVLIWNKE